MIYYKITHEVFSTRREQVLISVEQNKDFWGKMARKTKVTKESITDTVDIESTPAPSSNNSDELTPEQIQKIIEKHKKDLSEIFENADSEWISPNIYFKLM